MSIGTKKDRKKGVAKKPAKDARFDLRVTNELKKLVETAAKATGQTTTQFMIAVITERARDVIRDETIITLSIRDWEKVQRMIDTPSLPNKALQDAMSGYRANVSSDV